MSGAGPVMIADTVDIAVVEVVGIVNFVSSFHVSLPEIDEGIDKEEGRDGSQDEFGD